MYKMGIVSLLLLSGFGTGVARAQMTAAPAGIQGEVTRSIDDVEKKLVALAEATPQEKYSWKPAEGVRTTGEVFMHVAQANYGISTLLGAKVPEGVNVRELPKISEKAQVIDALQKSFAHARQAVSSTTDLESKVKLMGGREGTAREVLLILATHAHEHLGQSIAYARMNGIVPPWTMEHDHEHDMKKEMPKKP